MSDYLDPQNKELLRDFFIEAEGQVEALERNILVLESDPANADSVDEIFRAAHTLKGGAATVEMSELTEFTHLIEDVLDRIREGALSADEAITTVLLESVDVVKGMLEARSNGGIYTDDTSATTRRLSALLEGDEEPNVGDLEATPSNAASGHGGLSEYEILELRQSADSGEAILCVSVAFDEDNPMNTVGPIQLYAVLKEIGKVLRTSPEFESLFDDVYHPIVDFWLETATPEDQIEKRCTISEVTTAVKISRLEEPAAARAASPSVSRAEEPETTDGEGPEVLSAENKLASPRPKQRSGGGSVLRVDSQRIDDLLNLVTETVINKATLNQVSNQFGGVLMDLQEAENQSRDQMRELLDALPAIVAASNNGKSVKQIRRELLDQYGGMLDGFDDFAQKLKSTVALFRNTAQNLSRISGNLQEGVMRIRMVPVSQIFSRFPRLVRDLSRTLNKEVALNIEGEDTELDKSVIEDLLDPLIHCVRNSLDHGIEAPDEREVAGKSRCGQVYLKASNEGNMIIIEISDDGKGIDVEGIRTKAIERGLIHPSKILSDVEAFNLIFDPGFSTAVAITSISGRGVGLDVVRKQIEKLNGTVTVWSEQGSGSKFTIRLPLTLAIIQGLLVRVGGQIFAIPISSVIESMRIRPDQVNLLDNYEVFNLREDVLSLIRLDRIFSVKSDTGRPYHFVVVVGSAEKRVGLLVDALIGEEDVVIKPLKDRFTNSPGVAGATILGDGTVALIIDVNQLLELGIKMEQSKRLPVA